MTLVTSRTYSDNMVTTVCVLQAHQPVFVRLLQSAYRLTQCSWLTGQQKYNLETCIRTLADVGKLYLPSCCTHTQQLFALNVH